MKSALKQCVAFFGGFLLSVAFVSAAVLVCRECGYENPESSEICSHCKAKFPARPAKHADGETGRENPSGKGKFLAPDIVGNEINIALKHLESGDFEVANLFAKNAAALEMLTDPSAKAERSDRIVEIRKKSETGGMTVERKCPACGGTGKMVMDAQALNGKTTRIEVAGKSCQMCNGSGNVLKPSTMDERKFKIGRAKNRYTALQQSRKMVPLGSAWLPAELDGKLTTKQAVQLKRSVALPCPDCAGLGRLDCTKCKGVSEIKCTYQGCVNGKVEVKEEGTLSKSKMKKQVKCKNCNGTGFVTCTDCRSKGSIVCKKCNGSGERGICVRCAGQGFITCRRCQGSGKSKDGECAECRGEGVQECTACSGDGRKR